MPVINRQHPIHVRCSRVIESNWLLSTGSRVRRSSVSLWPTTPGVTTQLENRDGNPTEYHLIDLATGLSHGGFQSLEAARQYAREEGLMAWDIFRGNVRVEYHDPGVGSP